MNYLYVALGGAIGALMRYTMVAWVLNRFGHGFPWGTLSVNVLGSFCVGVLWAVFEVLSVSHSLRLFVFVGVLGALTTFSTFSLENLHFLRDSQYAYFLGNIFCNVIGCMLAVTMGFGLVRGLVSLGIGK